jgi:hypothetical protein
MASPIEDMQGQIEKDLAAKRAAKAAQKDSFPVGAGFMGAEADPDAREAEKVKTPKTGTEDKKEIEKKPEFSPEELKAIKDTAYFISEHRMSNDPARQKEWAKKYGLDENTFTKENIEKVLSANKKGEWTPDAQKFMQDWDWETAKKAVRNMKKAGEQAPDQKGATVDVDPGKTKMEDALKNQSKEDQRQIDNMAIENERMKGMENAEEVRKMEFEGEQGDVAQAELNKAITDFEEKQAQIAEMRAKKGGRWASLRRTLGLEMKNLDADPEVMGLEKESHDLYRDLMAKGIHLYKGDKPQLENFLKQFDEFEVFKGAYNQELNKKAEVAGYPENILSGFQTLTKKWSELKPWQKIVIGGGGGLLFTLGAGALGAGTFGAGALGLGWRWGFRAFGATAAGVGRNVMLDRQMMTKMESEAEGRLKEKMDMLEKFENNLDQGIENILSKTSIGNTRKDFEQRKTENALRATRFGLMTFAISSIMGESFRYASQATGINMGTIFKKIGEHTGISFAGIKESMNHVLSDHQPSAETAFAGTGPTVDADHAHQHWETSGASDHASSERMAAAAASVADQPHPAEVPNGPRIVQDAPNISEHHQATASDHGIARGGEAANLNSDAPGHGSQISEVHGSADSPTTRLGESRAPDAEGKMAILPEREVGYSRVGSGGGIERSAKEIVKAHAKDFGLDPNDPHFNTKAGKEAHELAKGLAEKYGMTYKHLNEIASHKVQVGDEIRIYKDPLTGKFDLTYNGAAFNKELSAGKVFGGNTKEIGLPSGDIEASQQIDSLEGGKLAPEGAGGAAAVEDMPKRTDSMRIRGGGSTQIPEEILEQERVAKENWTKATDYADKVAKWKAEVGPQLEQMGSRTTERQFLGMRGLLNQIVQDANIGKRADFWNQPIGNWKNLVPAENYIDSNHPHATDKINDSFDSLRKLYLILNPYKTSSGDTINECLLRAMKDPRNPLKISNSILK